MLVTAAESEAQEKALEYVAVPVSASGPPSVAESTSSAAYVVEGTRPGVYGKRRSTSEGKRDMLFSC